MGNGLVGRAVALPADRQRPARDARLPCKSPFVQLLDAVHEIDGLERIRFTSPHPKGYGDDLIDAYARLPKLVESAHLPVQSGSDRVLKLMHRGYTRERFLGIIQKLRRARPDIGITTDIIVGFPGETEEDFEETLSLAREVEFDNAYIFKYSQRRDTPAAEMPDQVPQKIREERNQRLLETRQRNRRAEIQKVHRAAGADSGGRTEPEKSGADDRPHALQQDCPVRRQRPPSRPAHGLENHPRRLLHALRRPGDCEFVNVVAMQFRPEKSGKAGLQPLRKLAELAK